MGVGWVAQMQMRVTQDLHCQHSMALALLLVMIPFGPKWCHVLG